MEEVAILIPAYNPDDKLLALLPRLRERFRRIVLVNDGSTSGLEVFDKAAGCVEKILVHERNRGKGVALKTGLRYIGDSADVVTADADGQHAIEDILRVGERIRETGGVVLGSRAFTGKVPLRSILGNGLSRFNYAIACSLYLQDNQTGLRAFETSYIPWLTSIPGRHYDYEISVLMFAAKRNVPIHEVTIQTIYIGENQSSHFRTVVDTLRLQGMILLSSVPSLLSFAALLGTFLLLYLRWRPWEFAPDAALAIAGGVGIFFSFLLNTCVFATRTGVPFRLSWRKLLVSVFRLSAYQLVLGLCVHFLGLNVGLSLTVTVLSVVLMEFLLLKFIVAVQDRRPANLRTKNL